MTTDGPRDVMNRLIETCRDAERGFRHAADLATDPALKSALANIADRRAHFVGVLEPHAQRLGGAEAAAGTTAAAAHRRWMDLRLTVRPSDDDVVLREVKRGDAITLNAYERAVNGVLPSDVRDIVEQQLAEVRSAHEYIDSVERTRKER